MLVSENYLFFNHLGQFSNLVSLIFKSETSLYIGGTPYFNIFLTFQITLIHFWHYLKGQNYPFFKNFLWKIKIFTLLIFSYSHSCKQPYTLIDIKEWVYEKIFCR